MKIRIVNKKNWKWGCEYVGRPSVLGNPFKIGIDGDRKEVIDKYRGWLWEEIKKKGDVYVELVRLSKIDKLILGCWCSPDPCHAEVVRNAIVWLRNQDQISLFS